MTRILLLVVALAVCALFAHANFLQSGHLFPNGVRVLLDANNDQGNCSATTEGTLQYIPMTKTLRYCDGAEWQFVSTSGSQTSANGIRFADFELESTSKLPVYYWDMESESSEGRLADFLGSNHLGQMGGRARRIHDCPVGSCSRVFDTNSFWESRNDFAHELIADRPKSMTGWMRVHTFKGDGDYYIPFGGFGGTDEGNDCSCSSFNVRYYSLSPTFQGIGCQPSGHVCDMSAPGQLVAGQWVFVAMTYDGISMKLYIDGSANVGSRNIQLNTRGAMRKIRIGANTWTGGRSHSAGHADFDDVRIYDYTLSPEEVDALYELGSAPARSAHAVALAPFEAATPAKQPISYWDMETRAYDGKLSDAMRGNDLDFVGSDHMVVHDCPVGQCAGIRSCSSYFKSISNFHSALAGSNPKTLTGWMRIHSFKGDGDGFIPLGGFGGIQSSDCECSAFNIRQYARSEIVQGIGCQPSGTTCDVTVNSRAEIGAWYFYAITYDGTQFKVYFNGSSTVSSITANLNTRGDYGRIHVGSNTWVGETVSHTACDADFDDVRIYGYALSPEELDSVMSMGSPPAVGAADVSYAAFELSNPAKRPHFYWDMNTRGADGRIVETGRGNDLSIVGNDIRDVSDCPVGDCIGVTSCSSYFESVADFDVAGQLGGNQAKSMAAWVRVNTFGGDGDMYVPIGGFGGTQGGDCGCSAFNARYHSPSHGVQAIGCQPSGTACDVGFGHRLDLGKWHHIVITYDQTTLRVYADGSQNGGSRAVSLNTRGDIRNVRIGANTWTGSSLSHLACDADFDDVRVYSYALSTSEIDELYALGSPPVYAPEAISYAPFEAAIPSKQPMYYWDMESVGVDGRLKEYIRGNNMGIVNSNVQMVSDCPVGGCYGVTSCSSYFESMLDFDGSLGGSSAKSFVGWIRMASFAGDGDNYVPAWGFGSTESGDCSCSSFNVRWYSPSGSLQGIGCQPSGTLCDMSLGGVQMQLNEWYFLALTYDGSNMKLYFNGSQNTASAARALNTRGDMRKVRVGANTWAGISHLACNADFDDVRIYNYELLASEVQELRDLYTV